MGYHFHERPVFIRDRMEFFYPFYEKLYNAVVEWWLAKMRAKKDLTRLEESWLNLKIGKFSADDKSHIHRTVSVSHFSVVMKILTFWSVRALINANFLLYSQIYYELGEVARKNDFRKFLGLEKLSDLTDQHRDWIKDVYFKRGKVFPGHFKSRKLTSTSLTS